MATTSEVKAGLDDAAVMIRTSRQMQTTAKANLLAAYNQLVGIPTQFADVIATVNGYGTSNAFEAVAKAELAKLSAEFGALQTALGNELTALGVPHT